MVVGFKVKEKLLKVERVLFWDGLLRGDELKIVALARQLIRVHSSEEATRSDGVDYYDDIHNGPNVLSSKLADLL